MNIFQRLRERRSVSPGALTKDSHYWTNFFNSVGLFSKSGQNVTAPSAMQVSAVHACVRVLSETIASLPCMIYKRGSDNSREVAKDHYLYPILHDSPNEYMTAYEFFEFVVSQLLLYGNAYALKMFDEGGDIAGLMPLCSQYVDVKVRGDGTVSYYYTNPVDRETMNYPSDFIWHLRDISEDGIVGKSRIRLGQDAIGLSMSVDEHGSKFFSNDATPSMVLQYPGKLDDVQKTRLRDQWTAFFSGSKNAYKTAVLDAGLTINPIGARNNDSQFQETRNFQVEEIARLFRVPCILIGHPDKTMTYASSEQFMLSFVTHTVRPWLVKIEQSIYKNILSERDRKKHYAEFKVDALLRGDTQSRYQAYATGRQWGWLSVNDIRALENMNAVENGDIYLQPSNMVEAGDKPKETMGQTEPVKATTNGGDEDDAD